MSSEKSPTGGRKRRFGPRSNAADAIADTDLSGKTMLITGCTSGIGRETAKVLALRGAHIIMANRNLVLSEELKKEILTEKPDAKVDLIACDLSSLQSVVAAAKEFKDNHWPLHSLILNAGVFSPEQKMTIDQLETTHAVNHVAHQLLVRELLPVLRQSTPSRIVVVSSHSHAHTGIKPVEPLQEKVNKLCPPPDNKVIGYRLYALSKMCNVLMAFKLHREEHTNGIAVYVLHPGSMIATDISRSYGFAANVLNFFTKPFTKTIAQGAATTVYCAASNEIQDVSGKYWESCWDDEKKLDAALARDEALQDALWDRTQETIERWESTYKAGSRRESLTVSALNTSQQQQAQQPEC